MKEKTGGPAFPSHGSMGEVVQEGMSLRDWFAGNATEEDVQDFLNIIGTPSKERLRVHRCKAKYAYADAMLAEREK